jgi:hypothetical protein
MPKAMHIAKVMASLATVLVSNSQASQTASTCASVLPGGCYTKPPAFSQEVVPLKQAVPMKAGLWRDELLDNNGKPEINSVIESCRSASDWRDHALAAGSEASEGCSQTKLISRQMGNPPTLQVGMSETCREDGKTLVTTSWLVRKDASNQALSQYEMHTSTQTMQKASPQKRASSSSKTTLAQTTRHTWLRACTLN